MSGGEGGGGVGGVGMQEVVCCFLLPRETYRRNPLYYITASWNRLSGTFCTLLLYAIAHFLLGMLTGESKLYEVLSSQLLRRNALPNENNIIIFLSGVTFLTVGFIISLCIFKVSLSCCYQYYDDDFKCRAQVCLQGYLCLWAPTQNMKSF